uniref:Ovule protein n=1 Tax=Strongyloides papillosus TaxID=174720 RepID=A0A0N5BCY4_STREA
MNYFLLIDVFCHQVHDSLLFIVIKALEFLYSSLNHVLKAYLVSIDRKKVEKIEFFRFKNLVPKSTKRILDESGIRTHASEDTSALNWRLRPLGHLA